MPRRQKSSNEVRKKESPPAALTPLPPRGKVHVFTTLSSLFFPFIPLPSVCLAASSFSYSPEPPFKPLSLIVSSLLFFLLLFAPFFFFPTILYSSPYPSGSFPRLARPSVLSCFHSLVLTTLIPFNLAFFLLSPAPVRSSLCLLSLRLAISSAFPLTFPSHSSQLSIHPLVPCAAKLRHSLPSLAFPPRLVFPFINSRSSKMICPLLDSNG